jgi:hypothetical protein
LAYLLRQRRNGRWGHLNLPCGATDAGITACVLARLGEVPSLLINPSFERPIVGSLDWLESAHNVQRGWGDHGLDDMETTAWAVIALRKHGRSVPVIALDFIRRCWQPDGGFGKHPESASDPETTALAILALGADAKPRARDAANFLSSWLKADGKKTASPLFVCAGILDWDRNLASLELLNQACQLTRGFQTESAFEQALLLQCMVRLRLNRAWILAAGLRDAQLDDGSWPSAAGPSLGDNRIISTVTAVSALVLGDVQPGLYFGSDLPRPRRL